jgi:5-methylcytosine-specific restriction endonuclease McrA
MASDDHFLNFTDELLTLIQDASVTTTYKYALLLAIIDLVESAAAGDAGTEVLTTSLTTLQIAARVIEIYWRQTLDEHRLFQPSKPMPGDDSRQIHVPRQSSMAGTTIDQQVLRFRITMEDHNLGRFEQQKATPEYVDLLLDVEHTMVRQPIPRLQAAGNPQAPLLYVWPYLPEQMPQFGAYQKNVRNQLLNRSGAHNPTTFNNILRFGERVPLYLLRLAPLLRPFVQQKWAEFVAKRSNVDSRHDDLIQYLFGSQRESLDVYRKPLVQFQQGRCFYCGQELQGQTAVDHFIPWSRTPNNAVENLVVAHTGCNSAKSDHFAATGHLRTWHLRPVQPGWFDLVKSVETTRTAVSDAARSFGIARSQYLLMRENKRLWVAGNEFEQANPSTIQEIFSGLSL